MIRHKFSVSLRNKIADCAASCDCCAFIDGARATREERKELQAILEKAVKYMDKKLGF